MIFGYGIEGFVTYTCNILIDKIENSWLKVYQNSSLRRIERVKLAKKENKLRSLLNSNIVFQLKDLWSCFTWIYLDLHEPWVLVETFMH